MSDNILFLSIVVIVFIVMIYAIIYIWEQTKNI